MNRFTSLCLAALALAVLASSVRADARDIVVEARVSAVTGASVYLNRGRADHVAEGDRVLIHLAGSGAIEGTVRSVSKNGSRAEVAPAAPPIGIGARVEIFIPESRVQPAPPVPPVTATPEATGPPASPTAPAPTPPLPTTPAHPPWTHPPESWDTEAPLLAPAFGLAPEEREKKLEGRVYARSNGNWDQQNGSRRYFLGSIGADVRLENAFDLGGALELDAEVFQRSSSGTGGSDDSDTQGMIRRLSYAVGGTPERPSRVELGRFLQHEFPELGFLDGVEWSRRVNSGSRFGASVGFMPEPRPTMDSSDDAQMAVFYRHAVDPDERMTIGAAYQNSWHRGEQDRNLFVGTFDYHPVGKFSLRSSVWVDAYGSEDKIKTSSVELTEAQVQATWRATSRSGASAFLSQVRYPETQQQEFEGLSPEQIRDGHVERLGLSGWHGLTENVRLNARVDAWQDQDDDGQSGEIGAAWRDILYDDGEVALALTRADGSYSSGPGLRVSASKEFERVFANLAYSFTDFEQKDFSGEQETLGQHALYGNLDLPLGSRWDLSLFAEQRFGDEQDSYSLGFMLQMRL